MPLKRPSDQAAARVDQGLTRLVVDIPAPLHKAMKLRSVAEGRTLREYLIAVLGADMSLWNNKTSEQQIKTSMSMADAGAAPPAPSPRARTRTR